MRTFKAIMRHRPNLRIRKHYDANEEEEDAICDSNSGYRDLCPYVRVDIRGRGLRLVNIPFDHSSAQ